MACPFFFPTVKSDSIAWTFPARLPLGAGFCGTCRATEAEVAPSENELRDFCNLGYSSACSRLPQQRRADCVRFAVAVDTGSSIVLHYVFEREHIPIEHGRVEFNRESQDWTVKLSDAVVQRQAQVYLQSYLDRRRAAVGESLP